ncbi:MAG: hypothetical protein U0M21_00645 [Emergencia sp.]|nr:hypothetical protein [Emergencia sp.]
MYMPYASPEDYEVYGGGDIPQESIEEALRTASRHIDSLTFGRIAGEGLQSLTDFQQDVIREVVCKQADFEYENEDALQSVLQSYGINGVNMSFGSSWNIAIESGVAIRRENYELLKQTGLCCRRI